MSHNTKTREKILTKHKEMRTYFNRLRFKREEEKEQKIIDELEKESEELVEQLRNIK